MIQIIIADDHRLVASGFRLLLKDQPEIEIVAEAHNGREVLSILETTSVDIILMDIEMPLIDGIETTKIVKDKYPEVKVLIISAYDKTAYIQHSRDAGADGYILKNTDHVELITAIKEIVQGNKYYSKHILYKNMQSSNRSVSDELTPREKEILILVASGLTTAEIADKLARSPHTVETHRKNLLSKLNVSNTAALIKYAYKHGLI